MSLYVFINQLRIGCIALYANILNDLFKKRGFLAHHKRHRISLRFLNVKPFYINKKYAFAYASEKRTVIYV